MKKSNILLAYDNSFSGFLSVIYYAFKQNCSVSDIRSIRNNQSVLFSDVITIKTEEGYARRVWQALQKKNYEAAKLIYFAYLSESQGVEYLLYEYINCIFSNHSETATYINAEALKKIRFLAGLVSREKKRMEADVHLAQAYSDLQVARVDPEFNVLPLITRYFKSSENTIPWIIYDSSRKYGVHFDGRKVHFISTGVFNGLLAQKHLAEPASVSVQDKSKVLLHQDIENKSGRRNGTFPETVTAA